MPKWKPETCRKHPKTTESYGFEARSPGVTFTDWSAFQSFTRPQSKESIKTPALADEAKSPVNPMKQHVHIGAHCFYGSRRALRSSFQGAEMALYFICMPNGPVLSSVTLRVMGLITWSAKTFVASSLKRCSSEIHVSSPWQFTLGFPTNGP